MHDRKNIGKLLLDPSLSPKPKEEANSTEAVNKQASVDKKDGEE